MPEDFITSIKIGFSVDDLRYYRKNAMICITWLAYTIL